MRVVGPRAGACGELGDQPAHDLPLLAAGVLRLIDQEMIDAEIEFVVNPGGIDIAEKLQRLVDQIVVIDESAAFLLVFIALQDLMNDGEERGGAIPTDHGAPPVQQRTDPALLRSEPLRQVGIFDRLGNDRFSRRLALRGAENIEISRDSIGSRQGGKPLEPPRLVDIGLGALLQRRRDCRPVGGRN